ncbi:MAG: T9SS type A sorting domain-containing protein, partial [Bacteroidota bacterium]
AWDNEVRVLMGNGQGNFSSLKTYYTSNGVRGVVVGDFDGDGWDDMLTTNRLAGNISIFKNAGDGTFTQTGMDVPGGDETSCALTDANGDGILDVYFAMFNAKKIGVLLGDGAGNFNLFGTPVSVVGKPWMIGAGDFNGDGKPDVASTNSDGNRTVVLFGDGAGGLSQPVNYTPPQHNFPLAIDIGDLDGDGDLDMVTSNYSSSTYTVFENDGAGQFTAAETLLAPEASSCAILHDRDNDGDLDITGTDEEADVILLFENADSMVSSSVEVLKNFVLNIYPNPTANQVRVEYVLEENSEVSMVLSNAAGQVLGMLEKKFQPAGNHVETWDFPGRSANGTYVLELFANGKSVSQKLIVV